MDTTGRAAVRQMDEGEVPARGAIAAAFRKGLRLAPRAQCAWRTTGPDKYLILDLRRRRAQIRARHALA